MNEEIITVVRIKDKTYEICKNNCLKILQIEKQNCYEVYYDTFIVRLYNVDEVYFSSIEKIKSQYEEWIKETEKAIKNSEYPPVPINTSEAIKTQIYKTIKEQKETRNKLLEERKKEYELFKKIYIEKQ
jgi:hypothetical protein